MSGRRVLAALAIGLCLFPIPEAAAQRGGARGNPAAASPAATLAGLPADAALGQLRFRAIGPAAMSGRVSDIAVEARRDAEPGTRLGRVVYITSAGGGVWKTTNGGKTWTPLTDTLGVGSFGAVTVAPSAPDIVWAGSGESNNLRSSSWGNGIYKSTDAGATWTYMGLRRSQHIARIVVHPTDAEVVFVAAMGPLWAGGGERGFYMTTDGGATWTRTLAAGEYTGVTDIALDPTDPNTIYAATYQRDRRAYSFVAGGPESGIHKSTDGGRTWTALTNGLPEGDRGRIGLAVSPVQPRTIYATVHASDGGVFRSDDGGATWTRRSTLQSIPWFFGQIRVDPHDPERVYHLGVQLNVSTDGGQTWRAIAGRTHADHHAMWIDPHDPQHMIIGNDGGLYYTHDRGETWDFAVNLPISTFYTVTVDQRYPHYWIYGGLQDNGTFGGPHRTRSRGGIANHDWVRVGGGDGFHVAIDPVDPTIVFAESQNGALMRVDLSTDERKSIRPTPVPGEPPLRYNWSAPLVLSHHDRATLYFAANHVFKSTDRGDSWTRLGGDLTRQLDRDTLPIMGLHAAGGLGRHDGTAPFGNISALAESKLRRGLLYAGSDDGLIHMTNNDGATWTRYDNFPGVPALTYVSRVIASEHDEATVYATFDGHRGNDFTPYVLKSTDYGATWRSIAANLPEEGSVQVIREHPRTPSLLFVGTEFGVFASVNGGESWVQLREGIPPSAAHDLVIHPRDNDLVVATHGRGFFVLDDLAPLETLARMGTRGGRPAVVALRPAFIMSTASGAMQPGDRRFAGENAPGGALLTYYVGSDAPRGASATLVVRDGAGNVVRELAAKAEPGVHRTTWDLRYESPAAVAAAAAPRGDDEDEDRPAPVGPAGPYVLAGAYSVEVRIAPARGAAIVSEPQRLAVVLDPEVRLAAADYAALHDARMRAYALQLDANALARRLDGARADVARAIEGRDTTSAGVVAARELDRELDAVLLAVRPRGGGGFGGGGGGGAGAGAAPVLTRVNGVANTIGNTHFAVTAEQREALETTAAELRELAARAEAVIGRVGGTVRALAASGRP
jgi:photosystem II stability/assembly factor-like uncharacterized protein